MRYRQGVTVQPLSAASLKKMGIDPNAIPQHVAVIMDGNGRWAQQRNLPRTEGHLRGEEALFECVEGALELGISWLTVFGFSTENWNRPKKEIIYPIALILLSLEIFPSERGTFKSTLMSSFFLVRFNSLIFIMRSFWCTHFIQLNESYYLLPVIANAVSNIR